MKLSVWKLLLYPVYLYYRFIYSSADFRNSSPRSQCEECSFSKCYDVWYFTESSTAHFPNGLIFETDLGERIKSKFKQFDDDNKDLWLYLEYYFRWEYKCFYLFMNNFITYWQRQWGCFERLLQSTFRLLLYGYCSVWIRRFHLWVIYYI